MTDTMIDLPGVIAKSADADFLRELIQDARRLIAAWRDDYNHHRPHSSLDGLTPREFRNRSMKDQTLNRLHF